MDYSKVKRVLFVLRVVGAVVLYAIAGFCLYIVIM